MKKKCPNVDVRYIGIYHYEGEDHSENIIFIDFHKDTYLQKKGHNSSAHVYINDLYQGMKYGTFTKKDKFGNTITVLTQNEFYNYLTSERLPTTSLFDLFRQFNNDFAFGRWLKAIDTIKEMYKNEWSQWRKGEWAGMFLEYKFDKFTTDNHLTNQMRYVGNSLKRDGDLDFDIRFDEDDFYGDLKASTISQKEAPGNDKKNFVECISRYKKFWYVIYEHETIKDSPENNYEAAHARLQLIKKIDPKYKKGEHSYESKMKAKVKFVKMSIIELNHINYKDVLSDFHQGHQPDGSPRAPKFKINKRTLNNDNYVIFRYTYAKKS